MTLRTVLFSLLLFQLSLCAQAEKMSYENHSLVISKLETAISLMKKGDASLVPTTQRLADLHSERARLAEFKENEKDCNNCMKSREDRLKAIDLYHKVMSLGHENGAIITQLAHLYDLTGQSEKSQGLYKRIIKKSTPTYSRSLVGEAHLSMGYIFYKANKNKKALYHFEQAKRFSVKQPKSVTNYYIAWCKFNLGQEKVARRLMELSLKSAIVEAKSSEEMKSFANQASRDLTIFYARTHLTTDRINKLLDLTPEPVRIANFKALANEVERLGKHKSTAKIWGLIAKVTKEPTAKIEAQFRYAKSNFNIGHLKTAQSQFNKATEIWKSQGCVSSDDFDCKELKIEFRNFVINWNNTEKSKPSDQLLGAYISYLNLFADDEEMLRWAAQVAMIRDNFKMAKNLYRRVTDLKLKAGNKKVEKSLLAEVEAAEKSKNLNEKLDTYTYYLSVNPKGKSRTNVRYQLAQTYYDLKKYKIAADIFCDIAGQRKGGQKIGANAAHLCLDAYALLKESHTVENYALKFAKIYPKEKNQFLKIARNASLNIVAYNLGSKADQSELRNSLARLEAMNISGATVSEKLKIYQNVITISEKLNNIPKALLATNAILALKKVPEKEKRQALIKKVWFSELLLDFKSALSSYKKLYPVETATRNQLLKMSLYAELAFMNTSIYDRKILAKTKSTYKVNQIRAKLVLASKQPWKEFNKNFRSLKKSKSIFTNLALEVYSKKKSLKNLNKVLKQKFVKNYASGQRLHRIANMKKINLTKTILKKHRISARSDKALARTLKRRIALIGDLEKLLAKSSRTKDWVGQVISLELISFEYHRLYNEILRTPVPRGLKAHEVAQYQNLLNAQASPYLRKSQSAKAKAGVFWRNGQLFSTLVSQHNQAKRSIQGLIGNEIKEISRYSPSANRIILARAKIIAYPQKEEIVSTYKKIQAQPFNTKYIANGISLEERRDRKAMVSYLNERLKLSQNRRTN